MTVLVAGLLVGELQSVTGGRDGTIGCSGKFVTSLEALSIIGHSWGTTGPRRLGVACGTLLDFFRRGRPTRIVYCGCDLGFGRFENGRWVVDDSLSRGVMMLWYGVDEIEVEVLGLWSSSRNAREGSEHECDVHNDKHAAGFGNSE